jgi:hypothetical protein
MFLTSWTQMMAHALNHYQLEMVMSNTSLIDKMREDIAQKAFDSGADFFMWLDADQTYPEETIVRLARHCEDGKLVVGGVTPHKTDGMPMVWKFGNNYGAGDRVRDFPVNRGLVKVDSMGFGGVMTARKVFDEIDYPRFLRTWDFDMNCLVGEDFCFYARCKERDIDVWCDTDLIYHHITSYAIALNDRIFHEPTI